MLRDAVSEYVLHLTGLDAVTQLFQGALQFLVDTHDALGIQPWMRAQLGHRRGSARSFSSFARVPIVTISRIELVIAAPMP